MPSSLRLTPTLAPESNRHKRPWSDNSRTVKVPLWTASPSGEYREGKFNIPHVLANAEDHTPEALRRDSFIQEKLASWVDWLSKRGWELNGEVELWFQEPLGNDEAATKRHFDRVRKVLGREGSVEEVRSFTTPDYQWCCVRAQFKRSTPIYVPLEDVLELNRMNEIYSKDAPPEDTGWVNPLEYAEQRRQRLGIKRKDYLLGKLSEPL